MKPVLLFRNDYFGPYKTYILNDEKTYYCSVDNPSFGFSLEKASDNPALFKMFESLEQANVFLKEIKYGVVHKQEADFCCPVCDRGYSAPFTDEYRDHEYNKNCVCGHIIKVTVEVSVNYTVK